MTEFQLSERILTQGIETHGNGSFYVNCTQSSTSDVGCQVKASKCECSQNSGLGVTRLNTTPNAMLFDYISCCFADDPEVIFY
eukprot:c44581_g1_i1 orf=243-491(+)